MSAFAASQPAGANGLSRQSCLVCMCLELIYLPSDGERRAGEWGGIRYSQASCLLFLCFSRSECPFCQIDLMFAPCFETARSGEVQWCSGPPTGRACLRPVFRLQYLPDVLQERWPSFVFVWTLVLCCGCADRTLFSPHVRSLLQAASGPPSSQAVATTWVHVTTPVPLGLSIWRRFLAQFVKDSLCLSWAKVLAGHLGAV